jgi:short-chain fatty acids transporter
VIMAFAHGDAWTNMLQPFWALPLLGITGLKASQLVGYTATLMILVLPIFLAAFLIF